MEYALEHKAMYNNRTEIGGKRASHYLNSKPILHGTWNMGKKFKVFLYIAPASILSDVNGLI